MAGKQQQWTTLQEPVVYEQQRDHFSLLPRGDQHEQAGNQPPQANYPPPQARYPPQQGGYPHQQASYPLQQGYPPWQVSYQPQEAGYTIEVINPQPTVMENTDSVVFGESPVRTFCPHC